METQNKSYKLSCDLFLLDYKDGNKILYAPRLRFSFIANPDLQNLISLVINNQIDSFTSNQVQVLDFLESKGIFNQNKELDIPLAPPKDFKPLRLTVFPTNKCNLRCIYCYASAGDLKPIKIKWIYVKKSIDFVVRNLLEAGEKTFLLGFHGGGEPLYEWALIKKTVDYAEKICKENDLGLTIDSATNGLLSITKLDWIIEHFHSLNISFDGNIFSQNYHRPLPSGKGSFEMVDRTMKYLDSKGFSYGIRSTVSSETLDQMEDSIRFIIQNYKCKHVHMEPIANSGRCQSNDELSIDLPMFARKFAVCEEIARKAGVRLIYSGCKFDYLTNVFCGLSNDNFAVTPDGYIASCFEITSKDDPRSDNLFIGRITDEGEIIVNPQKRDYINSIRVNNLDYCSDCYAKWHCGGECITRLGHDDYLGPRGNSRCKLNRDMIKENIIKILEYDSTYTS